MAPAFFAPPSAPHPDTITLNPIGDSPTAESNVPTALLTVDGASKPKVLGVLSRLLERLIERNEQVNANDHLPKNHRLTVFHGLRAPSIGVEAYLERIFKYANCSAVCFIVAYVYIDRLLQRHPDLPVTSLNVHRLLITTVMCAAKFLDDAYYNNAYYAKVGGVGTQEINRLEVELLFLLDFRLYVSPELLTRYHGHLEALYPMVAMPLAAAPAPAAPQPAAAGAPPPPPQEYMYTPAGVVPVVGAPGKGIPAILTPGGGVLRFDHPAAVAPASACRCGAGAKGGLCAAGCPGAGGGAAPMEVEASPRDHFTGDELATPRDGRGRPTMSASSSRSEIHFAGEVMM